MPIEFIPKFNQQFVDLYSPDGELIQQGLDEMQVLYTQIRIAQNKLEGYYIVWGEHHISISNKGELDSWPSGMFDAAQKMFVALMKLRTDKEDSHLYADITLNELFD